MIFKRGFAIFLLGIVVLSLWGVQWKTPDADLGDLDDLQPGDIIFVDIFEGWCKVGFWEHVAIYVGGGSVVEATFNGGIDRSSAKNMVTRDAPAKVAVRRLKDIPGREEVIQKAVDYALAQIGKPFDYTASPLSFPIKFNDENLSCSELVWRAYKAAGIDIDNNGGACVYPDDMYYNPKLEQVGW